MRRTFILAGPTGVGKSELAVAVAETLGQTEIVSADAYQIYEGLEVLTAAPPAALRARIPHHLVGCVPRDVAMDAARFAGLARAAIGDIHARGLTALLVGGSGLYLHAVFGGLTRMPESDPAVRGAIEAMDGAERLALLDRLDPVAGARIDRRNPRRVIRAIEVCRLTGRPYSSLRVDWSGRAGGVGESPRTVIPPGVLLTRRRDELNDRIRRRAGEMLDAGAIGEVCRLPPLATTAQRTLGVREIRRLLDGEISKDGCVEAIATATRQYAKRQMTWFRNRTSLPEINLTGLAPDEAVRRIATVLGGSPMMASPEEDASSE